MVVLIEVMKIACSSVARRVLDWCFGILRDPPPENGYLFTRDHHAADAVKVQNGRGQAVTSSNGHIPILHEWNDELKRRSMLTLHVTAGTLSCIIELEARGGGLLTATLPWTSDEIRRALN